MTQARIGIIGGTGLADALAERLGDVTAKEVATPFGKPGGPVMLGTYGSHPVAFLSRHGEGHWFNPSQVPYAANIFALKKLGVTTLIASGAVGSLRDGIAPCELALVDQFIDKTCRRQNTFFDKLGAVHVEFAQPVCTRLRQRLLTASAQVRAVTHSGATYVCMEGPQFSTRAESLMHKSWGADLIGMTAMPEARLAREAQMCYALVALVSDYDCWREHDPAQDKQTLLGEIIGNLQAATQNAVDLIEALLADPEPFEDADCPCRKALELAVWTQPEHIDPKVRKKLSVLFQ